MMLFHHDRGKLLHDLCLDSFGRGNRCKADLFCSDKEFGDSEGSGRELYVVFC